jgi:3-deoxy-D-manno-octulosonic-acid transferase
MGQSLALRSYLFLASRKAPGKPPVRPPRPEGPLLWIHASQDSHATGIRELIQLFGGEKPNLEILVTHEDGQRLDVDTQDAFTDRLPEDNLPDVRGFLDHWHPTFGLFIGTSLPPALITQSHQRGIPLALADVALRPGHFRGWNRAITKSLLRCFKRILAQDSESASALRSLGGRAISVELGGRLEEAAEPLPCVNADRDALAETLRARPVWLASACPEAEEEAVIAAHIRAMHHAHRLLLIIMAADPARIPMLAQRLADAGLVVADRAKDQDPLPDVQVLIADGIEEHGLWYRLAPVCFMAGTLHAGDGGRSPLEAAALGSAILHGPHTGRHAATYNRLTEARAARAVTSAETLADAVIDLIAPDKAAVLAHNAWSTTSGGTEAAQRLVQIVINALAAPVTKVAN